MKSVTSIIDRWPSIADFADDVGSNYKTVHSWKLRGRIPARWHRGVVDAAAARGISDVTLDVLARLYLEASRSSHSTK